MKNSLYAAAALAFALCASACASDPNDALSARTTTTVTVPAPTASSATIEAIDNNFVEQTTTVKVGATITFQNNGRNVHNVVPSGDPKATSWGVLDAGFQPKSTYTHTFDKPGTYVFYCTIHGTPKAGMFGTIIVTA